MMKGHKNTSIEAYGHEFIPYGSEEMICRKCDYVIWPVTNTKDAEHAVERIADSKLQCKEGGTK